MGERGSLLKSNPAPLFHHGNPPVIRVARLFRLMIEVGRGEWIVSQVGNSLRCIVRFLR